MARTIIIIIIFLHSAWMRDHRLAGRSAAYHPFRAAGAIPCDRQIILRVWTLASIWSWWTTRINFGARNFDRVQAAGRISIFSIPNYLVVVLELADCPLMLPALGGGLVFLPEFPPQRDIGCGHGSASRIRYWTDGKP